jgi:hypothetical protein
MHRSSTYVWRNARSRIVDLPECPSDLSEPQYANLIFYPYCHVRHLHISLPKRLTSMNDLVLLENASSLPGDHVGYSDKEL